jgi:predicted Zn-dependent protease
MPLTARFSKMARPDGATPPEPSKARPRLRWLAATLALAWPLGIGVHAQSLPGNGASASNLPALGDAAAQELSPTAERRLGDRIMRSILRDPDVVDDPLVLEYIDQVWTRLLAGARQRGEISPELEASHAWEPFLVRDRTVNAFALPGGYIGVHLGLLAMTGSPDELASVLAHELSHVTQRHIARMIGQQSRQSWVSLASLILGIMAASRNPQAAQAMIYGGQAVSIQNQLNFSRDMEREADRVGFGVLGESGFDQAGMAEMFEHLQQASRLNDDGSYPYLRTHPLTTERIGEARARLGPGGWRLGPTGNEAEQAIWAQHALMAARARVLMDTRSLSLQNLANPDLRRNASALQGVVSYYTAAMASQRSGDTARGLQMLQLARQAARSLPPTQQAEVQRILTLSTAETELRAHRPVDAASTLRKELEQPATRSRLDLRPEALLSAQVALALPEGPNQRAAWSDAAARLQTQVSNHPHDAAAWSALSELWQHLGEPLRAVRAEAEAVAAQGDLPGAIERLQGAQKRFRNPNAADVIELSVMDARLRAWQKQQREDLRDEAGS